VQGEPVTSSSELTSGKYFVLVASKGVEGFIYNSGSGGEQVGRISNHRDFSGGTTETKYVWEVTVTETDGTKTFSLKNLSTNNYISYKGQEGDARHNVLVTTNESEKANLVLDDENTDRLTVSYTPRHWVVYQTNSKMAVVQGQSGGGGTSYLHTNGEGYDGCHLSWWEGHSTTAGQEGQSNCAIAFYHVTETLGEPVSVTFHFPALDGTNTFSRTTDLYPGNTVTTENANTAYSNPYFTATGFTDANLVVSESNKEFHVEGTWNLPFDLNKTYRLKLRASNTGNDGPANGGSAYCYCNATASEVGVRVDFAGETPNVLDDKEHLWYFKAADADHVTLHSLALGDAQGVTATVPSENDSKCSLSASPTAFKILRNAGTGEEANSFSLQIEGHSDCCINDINGKLGIWKNNASPTDPGSRFSVYAPTEADLQNVTIGTVSDLLGTQFQFNADKIAVAVADPTVENMNALFLPVFGDLVSTDKYYRLTFSSRVWESHGTLSVKGYANTTGAIDDYVTGTTNDEATRLAEAAVTNAADVSQLWKFEALTDGSGRYALRNVNANDYYLGVPPGGNNATHITAQQQHGEHVLPMAKDAAGNWVLQMKDGNNYICSNQESACITMWSDFNDLGAPMHIQVVTSVPVTVGTTGYATLCLPFAASVPKGLTAYTVSEVRTSGDVKYVELVAVPDDKLPAKTGVILVADEKPEAAKQYDFAILTEEVASIDGNRLEGVTLTRHGYAENNHYGLKAVGGEAVLARNAADINVPSNKAILPATELPAATQGAAVLRLRPSEGTQTGLVGVETGVQEDVRFYDLHGRRVLRPSRGIYVTGDGRKVFVK